jgi:hypothetical protein
MTPMVFKCSEHLWQLVWTVKLYGGEDRQSVTLDRFIR